MHSEIAIFVLTSYFGTSFIAFILLSVVTFAFLFRNDMTQRFLIPLSLQVCLYQVLLQFDVFRTFFKYISDLSHFVLHRIYSLEIHLFSTTTDVCQDSGKYIFWQNSGKMVPFLHVKFKGKK